VLERRQTIPLASQTEVIRDEHLLDPTRHHYLSLADFRAGDSYSPATNLEVGKPR